MAFNISIAFHIIGIVLWAGGLFVLATMLKSFTIPGQMTPPVAKNLKKCLFMYPVAGMVIVVLSGLHQLFAKGVGFYFAQGWFHAKALFIVVLFVATLLVVSEIRRVVAGGESRRKRLGMIHGLVGSAVFVIVFATILGR